MTFEQRMESWWNMDERQCKCFQRWSLLLFKRVYITVDHFISNNLSSYASALTYNTTLAVVPVLAIIFAIARGFGFDNLIEKRIRVALDSFSPEMTQTVLDFVFCACFARCGRADSNKTKGSGSEQNSERCFGCNKYPCSVVSRNVKGSLCGDGCFFIADCKRRCVF